jgi:hypothetical protein
VLTALFALLVLTIVPGTDPFAFFQPSVTVTADDRRQLDLGEPIARVLPGKDLEVAVFGAVPVNIDGDRLVAWMRRIEALKKSEYVLAIHRFSNPPRIEDLASLVLDAGELSEVRACRPGHCALNVSSAEAAELSRSESADAAQQALRLIVLRRARAYLADGHPTSDETIARNASPSADLGKLVHHSLFLTEHLSRFANDLAQTRHTAIPGVESFLYWSKERLAGKAIVGVTEVNILRGKEPGFPDVLVVGKEFFATHYISASLGVTALARGDPGGPNYLVYVNRSQVDVLGGMLGGIIRLFMQRRLRAEAVNVLQGLRRRLESGEPPSLEKVSLRRAIH